MLVWACGTKDNVPGGIQVSSSIRFLPGILDQRSRLFWDDRFCLPAPWPWSFLALASAIWLVTSDVNAHFFLMCSWRR